MKVTLLRTIGTRDYVKYDLNGGDGGREPLLYQEGESVEVSSKSGERLIKDGLAVSGTVNVRDPKNLRDASKQTVRAVPPVAKDEIKGLPK